MKAFIVTLDTTGNFNRPPYGSFLWSDKYGRYVWRGELATTIGQLAELFTQAAAFLRSKDNTTRILSAVEVDAPELVEQGAPDTGVREPVNQPDDWQSQKEAFLSTIAELQQTIRLLSETSGRKKLATLQKG